MCKNIFCFSFICLSRLFDTNIAKLILYHLDDEWEKYWRIIDFKYFRRQIGPFTPQFSTIPSKFGSARQPLAQLAELYNVIGRFFKFVLADSNTTKQKWTKWKRRRVG